LRLRAEKASAGLLVLAEVYLNEIEKEERPESFGHANGCAWAQNRLVPIAVFRPLPGTSDGDESWIQRVAAMTHCALVMPALSALPEDRLIETIERLAFEAIAGAVVCEPHDLTAPPLTRLARGPWRQPTRVAEDRPAVSVCALLAETTRLLLPDGPVRAFLADVLRVVEPLGDLWSATQRESLYANLLGLEERIADERIVLGQTAPAVLRNFRLARQLLRLMETES